MKTAINITLFSILVTLFYTYVGWLVPQKEVYPPKSIEISKDMTQEEMIEIGAQIVSGKGTCLACHKMEHAPGERFPALNGMGNVAGTRREGVSAEDYLAEALYDPSAYIVSGFNPGMPPVQKAPINLTDEEILTVIAYLQSLGGEVTVTMETKFSYSGQGASAATASAPPPAPVAVDLTGEEIYAKYNCAQCHSIDADIRMVGPPLHNAGNKYTANELYEAILNPDAKIAESYPPNVMKATLDGTGFYSQVNAKSLNNLVEFLMSKKGN